MDAWMDGWTDGQIDGWVDGRIDGWIDGNMDESEITGIKLWGDHGCLRLKGRYFAKKHDTRANSILSDFISRWLRPCRESLTVFKRFSKAAHYSKAG